jgi:hypothetical protein
MGDDTGGIWSFQPGASQSRFVPVRSKVLVTGVAAQPLN